MGQRETANPRFCESSLLLCVLLLSVPACGGYADTCNIPICENGIYSASLQSGSVYWSRDGVPLSSATVATGISGPEDCRLTISQGKIGSPANPEPWRATTSMSLALAFETAGSSQESVDAGNASGWVKWEIKFWNLGDPRTWAVGEAAVPDSKIEENYTVPFSFGPDAGPTCCMKCLGIGDPASLHIVVEQAIGGTADFPLLVTPDYLKVFRLEYDGESKGCGGENTTRLSLRFAQTAADFSTRREPCTSGRCQ